MNKKWLAIGLLVVIGAIGFSEFHSINTKNQIEDDLMKAEERLKNAKIVLENRERAEEIRQRKIAIQRVDAQVKGVKKW